MIWGVCGACGRSCEAEAYCNRCRESMRRQSGRERLADAVALAVGLAIGVGSVLLLLSGGPR
jgi:hypothetical protein